LAPGAGVVGSANTFVERGRGRYQSGIILRMAMTLRLTEDEAEALRMQAEVEHRSMQDVAREAVREYIVRHAHLARVQNALDVLTPRYDELLDRLGKA
jgi:hypothetical protein